MKNLALYLKQGMILTNGQMEFKYEYDDNGETVVEIYNKKTGNIAYVNKEFFERNYNINELKEYGTSINNKSYKIFA